jgi:hypothetical protein
VVVVAVVVAAAAIGVVVGYPFSFACDLLTRFPPTQGPGFITVAEFTH